MTFKYKKEGMIIAVAFLLCLTAVIGIKSFFFKSVQINEPIKNVISYYNNDLVEPKMAYATTKVVPTTSSIFAVSNNVSPEEEEESVPEVLEYPYSKAPVIEDDGSIIYDGMTITELTNKLNKSLGSYMTNTGYFFAEFTRDTGLDPYLSVAIVLLETGCKWTCSSLTVQCNNIGGLKGGEKCGTRSYSRYDTLEEGIDSYLNIIYKNYYLKGLDTPEKMGPKYLASSQWAMKVNKYIEEIKAK